MPTKRALAAAVLLAGLTMPLRAQDAPSGVGSKTQVRSVEFVFEGPHLRREADLTPRLAVTGQGKFVGLRKALAILPLVPPIAPHRFDPVELQRDVIRLRQYYRESGFLHADVRYDVRYNAKSDLVWITYRIREGPQLRVRSLTFTGAADSALEVPPDLRKPWDEYQRKERRRVDRFGEVEGRMLADSAGRWFRDRGYPFASAELVAVMDTVANQADVMVHVKPGDRARIRAIEVEGNTTVPARHLIRQLPIGPGDWYSARELEQGRLQLTQLDIVRLAIFDAPRPPVADSTVPVRLRVTENRAHLLTGDAGFSADGGLTAQVDWTYRSFLGGVRTFTVGGLAQSGVLALENPQRLYRFGARFFQPYVGDRRLSVAGGPFIEYRDDFRDRSRAIGFEGALAYAVSPLRSLALGYSISRRRVMEYRFGADLGPIDYLPILGLATPGAVDTLESVIRRSTISLQGSYGQVDEFTYPRKGYVLRPRIEVTAPSGLNSSEYLLLDLGGSAFVPLRGRIGLAFRGGAARLFPFGKSVAPTANESPIVSLLRLEDVTLTAGGTRDVRGWGTQLVGPKVPEVQVETVDGETRTFAEHYTPIGGLARLTASAELRFPIPALGDAWEFALFADGGRIWIPDRRFALNAGLLDQDDFYTAVGFGMTYVTVVGAVQFAVGYKLNPSAVDVRSADDVLNALAARQPITSKPENSLQRVHLHFAIGTTF